MTQIEAAKNKVITKEMRFIAKDEGVDAAILCRDIAAGKAVIMRNKKRKFKRICAVGRGLRTKVNANIGTSTDRKELKDELEKLKTALKYGADTIMDLSVGGNLRKIRKILIAKTDVPFGTVPIYEAAKESEDKYGNFLKITPESMFEVLERQAEDGVDFFTVHCGITQDVLGLLKKNRRILGIVSRGGAILAQWMHFNKKENPFYENFGRVIEIAKKYDIALSLGDGMRPGAIADASDDLQLAELRNLGKLAKKAQEAGVSVIIEGPGHVPLDQIERNVALEKEICRGAPFYVLGPLVTDIAAGYDHISGAIGGALAASFGADFLCYLTPAEHLRHPSVEDVREGVIASRIAAHAADIVKFKKAGELDKKMSLARKERAWEKQIKLSIDPQKAEKYRKGSKPHLSDVCTMCGEYCSIRLMEKCLSR
ncbi:MAG: phosphomethylpyrimidine synthase ThiC [Candidatus Omnitrophota bacterium]|nr:phosphomethylpyrimidine synthase ThiC [Candidatus Omnitrophota bacterium]